MDIGNETLETLGREPAPSVSVWKLGKRFGELQALDDVSLEFDSGCFHAILGENGAGKSTLVKCMLGFYTPTTGSVSVNRKEREIRTPREAHQAGLGMVYQHFTLVPSMTVAENLVLGLDPVPAFVSWRQQREAMAAFIEKTPFNIDIDRQVSTLAAGEKQKLEIIKQLYLGRRFIVLDEPTSVLTPAEADQILGLMRELTDSGVISVVLITHKLREVQRFAREVSVLRGGRYVGGGAVADYSMDALAELMVGRDRIPEAAPRTGAQRGGVVLSIRDLAVDSDRGVPAVRDVSLDVRAGEILGVAGVSGNGQRELVETLAGQRPRVSGEIMLNGESFRPRRQFLRKHGVYLLSEEPLHNSAVKTMSVADNLALRNFDEPELTTGGGYFVRRGAIRRQAERLIDDYGIRTQGAEARLDTLSGGNVQRTVLARELSGNVSLLIAQNPCFGLDLAAVAEIRNRIVAARNKGASVLLISEDLDEILELSDRIVVMFDGAVAYETDRETADVRTIGRYMASNQGLEVSATDQEA
ncbi:simple sugar transport system ATP-binding protein [Natronocella acetinitrilica]|uniref:Simple sugar transport system ATP-binding protein n=1 Tax=Natronocella acetinitrilica TaxID=414046 RepID=A0AAE3KAG8_9GAMM|nr:ABC transporter ATP-binding protein [Natronocella acetinitrilica]MCP1673519.1 simple sugar transport system ATP-binding protein [Natronocella acetinitrilica]